MAEYSTWDEVKAVLNDPAVSDDDKARILRSFADVHGSSPFINRDSEFWDNADEIEEYADRYDVTGDIADRLHRPFLSEDQREAGQETLDQQLARAEWDQAVDQAGEELEDLPGRTVEGGGSGVGTSDEILEPGSRGMGFFTIFLPQYHDWRGGGPDLHSDFEDVYDELKGIAFGKFRADAVTMGSVHGELTEITLDLSTAGGDLRGVWSGPAADAADAYGRAFVGFGREVADAPETTGTLISEGIAHIETAVLQRAETVFGLWADTVDGLTPQDVSRVIQAARTEADRHNLRDMRDWPMFGGLPSGVFSGFGWLVLGWQVRTIMAQAAQKWLDGTFVAVFDQKKKVFDDICAATKQSVSEGWSTIIEGLGAVEADPFAELGGGIEVPRPDTEQGPGSTGPDAVQEPTAGSPQDTSTAPSTAVSPSTPTAPPGGSAGSGDSSGGSSSAPTQSAAAPQVPQVPTGSIAQLDPTTGPGTGGGGKGTGVDPVTGGLAPDGLLSPSPGLPPGLGAEPDAVTITDGDVSYTVTEPDANGRATLTVDTGDGKPKTYQLDFGPREDAAGTGGSGGIGGAGGPGVADAIGRRIGAESVLTPEPGTDKITVTDTLTAERTEDGKIVLSSTEGGGAPKSYTVDFQEPAASDFASRLTGEPVAPRMAGVPSAGSMDIASGAGGSGAGGGGGSVGGGSAGGGSFGGGGGGGVSAPATPVGPGSMAGAMPAEALSGGQGGGAAPAAAPAAPGGSGGSGGGVGGTPMMGGMGGGGGGNSGGTEREANRYLVAKDVFDEDFDRFARVKGMLDPESAK